MSRSRSALVAAGLLSLTFLMLPVAGAESAVRPAADTGAEKGRLVLLLDSSGSMKEPASGGTAKIDAAKDALGEVVEQLPESAEVGIRVFGAKVFSRKDRGACTDTQNVVPVGPLDRAKLTSAVQGYKPYGETPIGNALKGAARDLGPEREGEKRTIVLLSDGEPTCAPDPCKVAAQLRQQGIDLRINVVGLDVSGKARSALQCIAKAGGGRYFDASSAEDLADSLVQVSVRSLRLFSLSGDPVTGGESPSEPTEVEPGTYTDESLAGEQPRYYLVDVPEKGSISASAVMRPTPGDKIGDALEVTLATPDGQEDCASDNDQNNYLLGRTSIFGAGATYAPFSESLGSEECSAAKQLLVSVGFSGDPTPYSLRVTSYPEATNVTDLPEAVDTEDSSSWERQVSLGGAGKQVIGGASFESAPELEPGTTYSDTLRPREQLIYKVPVGWGQSPRVTARVGTDPTADKLVTLPGVTVQMRAFNPLGEALETDSDSDALDDTDQYEGGENVPLTVGQPPVRLRNLDSTDEDLQKLSVDGFYYFSLEMSGASDRATERFQAPVQLAVAVDGEETGAPEYAEAVEGDPEKKSSESSKEKSTEPATKDDDSSTPWVPIAAGVGGLLLVAIVAGAFLLGRSRRT